LRPLCNALGGDDISARIGTVPLGDPDLPIDFLLSKSEKIAFNPVDHTAAKVLDVDDIKHQLIVGIRQQQIGGWERPIIWPSENESVMSGKVEILPSEVEPQTSVCGTLFSTL